MDHSVIIHIEYGFNQDESFWEKIFIHFPNSG
jgi:hypothetical protein